MESLLNEALAQYLLVKETHTTVFQQVVEHKQLMSVEGIEQTTLVDTLYVFKQTVLMMHDMRKELDALVALIEKIVCAQWVTESLAADSKGESIRGKLATGTPSSKQMLVLPKKGTPEYDTLLKSLGVGVKSLKNDLVRVHWPGMIEHVTKVLGQGRSIPGCDSKTTYPVFKVATRKTNVDVETFAREQLVSVDTPIVDPF